MCKKKNVSNQNFSTKKLNRERKDKEKSSIICYECKNPGHFKLKCPNLDKSNDKKIYFKPKDKKLLMIIWEDLDDSSSNQETEEEANLCLVATLEKYLMPKQVETSCSIKNIRKIILDETQTTCSFK